MAPVFSYLCCLFNPETPVHRTCHVGYNKSAKDHPNNL